MTTNVYLHAANIQGGVYNSSNGAYTFFLMGTMCVLPKELVEKHTQGNTPEERIEYVTFHGINSGVKPAKNIEENKPKESFLNLRNHE